MDKKRGEGINSFIKDTNAYIPFAVIGIFILLFSLLMAVNLTRMDYQLAEVIYSADISKNHDYILDTACTDISRCLNYAGMEALEWQGEHPIIQKDSVSLKTWNNRGFIAHVSNKDIEPGNILQVNVELPSNIFGNILAIFSDRKRVLTIYDDSGSFNMSFNYNESHSLWGKSSFTQEVRIPPNASYGYGYVELKVGNEVQATDWFYVGTNPIKDIVALRFNEFMKSNYRNGMHRTGRYILDVNEDITPAQIIIDKVNGTLKRSIRNNENEYIIHYTLTIKHLNYTLTDLDTGIIKKGSMDIFTPVDSREPLLAQLSTEYEKELNTGVSPDIVLGLSNVRSFTYGPWQHYAGGPLNIITDPSIAGFANMGTIYAQKRVFDAVDPWTLMYTGYYNGKIMYSDVTRDNSDYNVQKGNLSAVFGNFAQNGSFNMNVEESIKNSMEYTGTTLQEVEDNASITLAISNYTSIVKNGWIFNDQAWKPENPDLIHNVTDVVYSAEVMPEILRNGVNDKPAAKNIQIMTFFDPETVNLRKSLSFYYLTWDAEYLVSLWHEGAIVPGYSFKNISRISYSEKITKPGYIADLDIANWHLTDVKLRHKSTSLENLRIRPVMRYAGNDTLLNMEREGGFLNSESHFFDWNIEYIVEFDIYSQWEVEYSYAYTYEGIINSAYEDDRLDRYDHAQLTHEELERENITIVYHKCFRTKTYDGLENYGQGVEHDFINTTIIVDGTELIDTCCSDAADKYREAFVDIAQIEREYGFYGDGTTLPRRLVRCDVPAWLPGLMAKELLCMLHEMEESGPMRKVSLIGDNLGTNPADLLCEAAEDMALQMERERENYIMGEGYFSGNNFTTCSDAARIIAMNEAYEKIRRDVVESNVKLKNSLDAYVNEAFSKKTGSALSDLLGGFSPSELIFNNPALSMATNELAWQMGIIDTMEVVGWPHSKYTWTENMTILVDQYPDYLYHDEEFDLQEQFVWTDEITGKIIYPLAVRNKCVFSGDVSSEVANIMKGCTDPVKTTVSQQMSSSILEVNSQVNDVITHIGTEAVNLSQAGIHTNTRFLKENQTRLMTTYADQLRRDIPTQTNRQIAADPVLSRCIDLDRINMITEQYLYSLTNDELVAMTSDDTLVLELFSMIKDNVDMTNAEKQGDVDIALLRLEADMQMGVSDGVCAAIEVCHGIIDECFSNIENELQSKLDDCTGKLTGKAAEKTSKKLETALRCVPSGLPLLPPNWVCTVNVWEYDVKGRYKSFTIIDVDNECIVDPFFGHKAQVYVREYKRINHPTKKNLDGSSVFLGINIPITFAFDGYAATVVGPGPKGVGDKVGGREEKSADYDNFDTHL